MELAVFVFIILFGVAIGLLILFRTNRSTNLGRRGEWLVAMTLKRLPESDYTTLNNVLLTVSEKGDTVQIDHIVVSSFGVFVIETKCYSGKIYGSENKEYWTQYFKYDQYELRNPIIQNRAHVNALRKIFAQYGDIHLIPIVVFAGSADLYISTSSIVVYRADLLRTIRSFSTYYLMPQQRAKIVEALTLCNQSSDENDKKHSFSVSLKSWKADYDIRQGRCPKCGGNLVLRNGRFGEFYGCSNYPKCRFILDR